MFLSATALSHSKPASSGTYHDYCRTQGHEKLNFFSREHPEFFFGRMGWIGRVVYPETLYLYNFFYFKNCYKNHVVRIAVT
jgi:hypothetical protein